MKATQITHQAERENVQLLLENSGILTLYFVAGVFGVSQGWAGFLKKNLIGYR